MRDAKYFESTLVPLTFISTMAKVILERTDLQVSVFAGPVELLHVEPTRFMIQITVGASYVQIPLGQSGNLLLALAQVINDRTLEARDPTMARDVDAERQEIRRKLEILFL